MFWIASNTCGDARAHTRTHAHTHRRTRTRARTYRTLYLIRNIIHNTPSLLCRTPAGSLANGPLYSFALHFAWPLSPQLAHTCPQLRATLSVAPFSTANSVRHRGDPPTFVSALFSECRHECKISVCKITHIYSHGGDPPTFLSARKRKRTSRQTHLHARAHARTHTHAHTRARTHTRTRAHKHERARTRTHKHAHARTLRVSVTLC